MLVLKKKMKGPREWGIAKGHAFSAMTGEEQRRRWKVFPRQILIGIVCLFLVFHQNLKAENYPSECHLSIWTDGTDCSEETLLIYQIGAEYDPIEESICWASFLDDGMILRMKDEKEIPSLITELEHQLKKEKPFVLLSPEKDQPADLKVTPGVYLLIQDTPKCYQIQSSLIAVPYMNEAGDGWIGEREIYLKTAPVPEESEPGTPNTGDETKPGILFAALLMSMLAIGMMLRTRGLLCVNNKK